MENFVSSWSDGKKLHESYVFPLEKRPGNAAVKTSKNVRVIDIGKAEGVDRSAIIQQIMQASQEFGFFQVVNHGMPMDLKNNAIEILEKVVRMSPEEREKLNLKDDINNNFQIYRSSLNYKNEEFHCWRDALRMKCEPLESIMEFWPQDPQEFREIVSKYIILVKELSLRILECLSEGLGLDQKYLETQFTKSPALILNHYPSCPEPSLTLGIRRHKDPTFVNVLQAGPTPGLQILQNGEWFSLETPPYAFLVFLGNQIEVVSNGILKAVEHRVVSSTESRTSLVYNMHPSDDCVISPAKALVEAQGKALYKTYQYKDFLAILLSSKLAVIEFLTWP